MNARICLLIALLGSLALSGLSAQEGHPLSGTWSGDWGSGNQRTHLTVVFNWDGKTITGTINPGLDPIQIGSVALDVTNWEVHFEAEGKDSTGKAARIVADARIDDLGSYHRKLTGTWTQGTVSGELKLTRD